MKSYEAILAILIALVGAHVPRAFTVLYCALGLAWFITTRIDPRPLIALSGWQTKVMHIIQILVALFSCAYPLALLHFGIWQFAGRQLLDIVNSFLLPSCLFWFGTYLARRNFKLLVKLLIAYSIGALVFLLAALFYSRGIDWYAPQSVPGALSLAWGSATSMNVRSVEQNGILSAVYLPVGIYSYFRGYKKISFALVILGFIGLAAVLPLANGRLWIPSLAIASVPSTIHMISIVYRFLRGASSSALKLINLSLMTIAAVFLVLSLHTYRYQLCDERFGIYLRALSHSQDLLSGGRFLAFTSYMCDGSSFTVSLRPGSTASLSMLHSVPLDILASVGQIAFTPMLLVLITALYFYLSLALSIVKQVFAARFISVYCQLFWSFSAALLVQWLFQPLIYGDNLLYMFSYSLIGALVTRIPENLLSPGNDCNIIDGT